MDFQKIATLSSLNRSTKLCNPFPRIENSISRLVIRSLELHILWILSVSRITIPNLRERTVKFCNLRERIVLSEGALDWAVLEQL